MRRSRELVLLAAILAVAAWLRLRALELVEFKLDEAIALELARALLDGALPSVGLTSSIGAVNPPLFVYLTALPLLVHDDPLAATAFVGVLGVVAVGLTYAALRPRFGAGVALTAASLFATAPWAVLAGRKLWAQNLLPAVAAALLCVLFVVLEQRRTRLVVLVPLLLCAAFQLNFSALALVVPVLAVLAYRARDVHWPAVAAGVGAAALLLAPWLVHEWRHDFHDVNLLLTEGRGGSGSSAPGAGTLEAVRQTVRLIGGLNWQYLSGESTRLLADDAGLAWTLGRAASVLAGALLALGVVTSAVRVARTLLRMRTLDADSTRRALLLVWLGGVWLSFAASATGRVYPHYLLVTYPVSFAVAALGLWDVAGLGRRRAAAAGAAATAVVGFVALAFVAFTLAFQSFLADYGGTAGDYGLVYRDKEALADDARARGLRVPDDPVLDLLVAGHDRPPATPPYVTVQNSLSSPTSLPCDAELRRYGLLEGCFPP